MSKTPHLLDGPISSEFIANEIDKHQTKTQLGAHAIFIGTVRADKEDGKIVSGIQYSAYEDMIAAVIQEIKNLLFAKYNDLSCLHIYHGTGLVKVGEHSLFVMVSSGHRKQAFAASEECVELIKEKLPVWKKEVYKDGSHKWLDQ
jgi:molybdopterin synthase catalytic subunit